MCTHDDHETLWPDLPRLQNEDCFYSHTTKCKKCYIYLQTERVRRARQGLGPAPRASGRRAREVTGPQQQAILLEQYQSAMAKQRPPKRRAIPAVTPGEDPATEALLGQPVLHLSSSSNPEDAAALRGAAVATAWGAAILDEVRDLCPPGTELPEQVRTRRWRLSFLILLSRLRCRCCTLRCALRWPGRRRAPLRARRRSSPECGASPSRACPTPPPQREKLRRVLPPWAEAVPAAAPTSTRATPVRPFSARYVVCFFLFLS
jgi:hypothetical protein